MRVHHAPIASVVAAAVVAAAVAVLLAAGHARAIAVAPARLDDVVPASGATVPTNARLIAFSAAFQPGDVTFTRVHGDGTRDLLDVNASTPRAFIVPLGDVAAGGEDVVVEPDCATCSGQLTFTAGTGPDTTPPVWDDGATIPAGSATDFTDGNPIFPQRQGYEIGFVIPRVTDDGGGPVLIDFKPDEGAEILLPAGAAGDTPNERDTGIDAPNTGIHYFLDGPDERTTCADVVAVDVAGNETPFPDRACVELVHTAEGAGFGGCASTRAASPLGAVALVLLVSRRRRRVPRRCHRRGATP
jgi:hypothetical protein